MTIYNLINSISYFICYNDKNKCIILMSLISGIIYVRPKEFSAVALLGISNIKKKSKLYIKFYDYVFPILIYSILLNTA